MLALVMAAAGDFSYTIPQGVLPFALDIGKELLVGFTLGFFVNLMLQLFSLAGELSDYQIGLSMARSYDPTFGTTSLVTQYYSWWFMILLLYGGRAFLIHKAVFHFIREHSDGIQQLQFQCWTADREILRDCRSRWV